jgi:hypothetical protein
MCGPAVALALCTARVVDLQQSATAVCSKSLRRTSKQVRRARGVWWVLLTLNRRRVHTLWMLRLDLKVAAHVAAAFL